jgi:hypothetical protein
VPAVNIGTTLFACCIFFCSRTIALADFSYLACGNLPVFDRASKIFSSALVARTLLPFAASDENMDIICSIVLPGQ